MFHPNKVQPNQSLAALQRTFYPKHVNYFGDGSGRDVQVVCNNGTLNAVDKRGMMGHHGVQLKQYNNSNGAPKPAPSPVKEATTFYYQSDGTGRDSYVLKNNGGLRPEYTGKTTHDRLFKNSLRSETKSPLRTIKNQMTERANFDSYQNWHSVRSRQVNTRHARMQRDLINRLTRGSPERETTINYIIGCDQIGRVKRMSISSYQGTREPYISSQSRVKEQRSRNDGTVKTQSLVHGGNANQRGMNQIYGGDFMSKRRATQSLLMDPRNLKAAQSGSQKMETNTQDVRPSKQQISELVDIAQPQRILDRISKNQKASWKQKRQQLIANLSQSNRSQTIDDPTSDGAAEPLQLINQYQGKLESRNNFNDYFKKSDRKIGLGLQKLTPINEERALNSLVAPSRRKSLDPRALNMTISHSSGNNLLSERLKDKQMNNGSRPTSLADAKHLAKQAQYLEQSIKASTIDAAGAAYQESSTKDITRSKESVGGSPHYKGFFLRNANQSVEQE